jgi:hypothetical protein
MLKLVAGKDFHILFRRLTVVMQWLRATDIYMFYDCKYE